MARGVLLGVVAIAMTIAVASALAGSGTGILAGDTFVNSAPAAINNNTGGSHGIIVGKNGASGTMHGLVRFNMPAGLAGRATVTSTQLALTLKGIGVGSGPGTAATYSLYKITQNWAEGTGAADAQNTFTLGQPCSGAAASWNQANCGAAINWTTPGGTAAGTASASQSSTGLAVNSSLTFSSGVCAGTNMTCDVQSWIDSGNPFGWMIVSSSTTAGQAQKFYSHESATTIPSLAFNFNCKAGFKDLGTSCTTCTDAANTDCVFSHTGNSCNDAGPPSTTYSCTCDPTIYKTGTGADGKPACVIGCSPINHCRDNGDSAAACTDTATGYSCTCDSGFVLNSTGTSCVTACPGTPDPCGAGIGTCTPVTGGWTCACNTGYVSTGGAHPSCVDYNACNAAAIADCTTYPSNFCADNAPPSITYHCSCGNPATTNGTGTDGNPACVDINDCAPNHCQDGGDTGATCTDPGGQTLGYSCTCSSALWTQGAVLGSSSCVDVNECASGNPCGSGICSNVPFGGGYTCACNTNYTSTAGPTPTCVLRTTCNTSESLACVTSAPGNTCTFGPAGHTCACNNPAYVASANNTSCMLQGNSCAPDHCGDGGDATATCTPNLPDAYTCSCGAGWRFDGTTCVDIDECLAGGNPCGNGICTNVTGSYACSCDAGFHARGAPPTCVADSAGVQVTTSGGGCGCTAGSSRSSLWLAAVVLVVLARRRRRVRAARRA